MLDERAEKAEVELEGCLNCADGLLQVSKMFPMCKEITDPSSTLFNVSNKGIRYSSILQGFVYICSLPTSPKKHGRGANIFCEGSRWEPTNLIDCSSSYRISRAGAPCHTGSVFDCLCNMDK